MIAIVATIKTKPGMGAEFELDYVFPEFYEGPVSFGRAVAP